MIKLDKDQIIQAIDELDDWQEVQEIYEHCFDELNEAGQFEKIEETKK